MTGPEARRFAAQIHGDAPDRYGARLFDHIRRVAAAVPAEARAVAWLHETLESTSTTAGELRAAGVSESEVAAVTLLTRGPDTDAAAYQAHIDLIAAASGPAGDLARVVKRADLQDRIRHEQPSGPADPPHPAYRDALAHLDGGPVAMAR